MNDKIKELLKQSTTDILDVPVVDQQRFAELIIRECIGVVNKRYMGDNNREDMEVRRCVEDIKKHFGVAE